MELVSQFSALENGMTALQNRVGNNLAWQYKDYKTCKAKTSVFRTSPNSHFVHSSPNMYKNGLEDMYYLIL